MVADRRKPETGKLFVELLHGRIVAWLLVELEFFAFIFRHRVRAGVAGVGEQQGGAALANMLLGRKDKNGHEIEIVHC